MTTLLVIDIGNTNVSLGLFDYPAGGGATLSEHWRIGTHRGNVRSGTYPGRIDKERFAGRRGSHQDVCRAADRLPVRRVHRCGHI